MKLYVEGKTIEEIKQTWERPIDVKTIKTYLYKAAREMTPDELRPLAQRMGMNNATTFSMFREALRIEFTEKQIDREVYEARYKDIVLQFYPHLKGEHEWRGVQATSCTLAALGVIEKIAT